ncbi:acyl-CoA thioesterase [Amycolatopsis alba]|nr:acyl-CoA thioesterase [Amycolatopsis alba]
MTAFTFALTPRRAETDFNGHVTAIAYHDWADRARVAYLRRAGVTFVQGDFGPVLLEARINYLNEVRFGDEITVSVEPDFGAGKTWRVHQRFLRSDGVLAARIESTWGLLDHRTRRLTEDPHHTLSELATDPGRL